MGLPDLEKKLFQDINWRINEISQIKTIPFRYKMTEENRNLLIKYSVTSIYALWEGFVVNTFEEYNRELNSLKLKISKVHKNLITHAINCKDSLRLENSRIHIDSQIKFIEELLFFTNNQFEISGKLPTESNVNYKVINKILYIYNLELLSIKFERKLNKLLKFRNNIGHGDNSIPIVVENINEFSLLVIDLINELFNIVINGYRNKTYLS